MAKRTTFSVGDIVKLKSGGPEMTVKEVPDISDKFYECQWFAGKKLERGKFRGDSLEPVKDSQP